MGAASARSLGFVYDCFGHCTLALVRSLISIANLRSQISQVSNLRRPNRRRPTKKWLSHLHPTISLCQELFQRDATGQINSRVYPETRAGCSQSESEISNLKSQIISNLKSEISNLCCQIASHSKRLAAAARARRVGIGEDKSSLHQSLVFVIKRRAVKVQDALHIDEDLYAVLLEHLVARPLFGIDRQV